MQVYTKGMGPGIYMHLYHALARACYIHQHISESGIFLMEVFPDSRQSSQAETALSAVERPGAASKSWVASLH